MPMHLRWNPDNPDSKMLVCSAAIFAQYVVALAVGLLRYAPSSR